MNDIVKWRKKLLSPVKGLEWASEMVLNPAIIENPATNRIHMIFRATGPWQKAQLSGKPLPYPIFMGYGYSDDGMNFTFELTEPVLSPGLQFVKEDIYVTDIDGEKAVAYTNGCIEDPRLFFIEGTCYMTLACRMFPAGPYWDHDEPTQCMPKWALGEENVFGTQKNPTVNVLFQVDLDALEKKEYAQAFQYVTNLTEPCYGEDRDVFLFPKKMQIAGEECYVMIHRPGEPFRHEGYTEKKPSIMLSAAKELKDFGVGKVVKRKLLLAPAEDWQLERVGGSTPPLELENGRWLFCYHGKKDAIEGYAQSFMILKEQPDDFPVIERICKEKMIVNEADFEAPSKFKTPCVFFTGMIEHEGDLLISYGAADEHVGIMLVDKQKVLEILAGCN